MKRISVRSLALSTAFLMLGCAKILVADSGNPQISSVTPAQVAAGGQAFSLTVFGSGFVGNAVVLWNGSPRATQFISKTQLQASIASADIRQAGSVQVTVGDQRGNAMPSNPVFLTIQGSAPAPLAVSVSNLPAGELPSAYAATLNANGGVPPYKWGIASGSLPPGLALSSSTGAVSGTPTGSGHYSFTAQVQDSQPSPLTATAALGINIAPPLQITTTSLPSGQVQAQYQGTVAVTGGITPDSWSVILGSLPPGLALNASTGVVSGTPTTAGQYSFTLQVQDSASSPRIAVSTLNINIAAAPSQTTPPQITTSALPPGTVQLAYSAPLAATGGTLPYSWSVVSGSLPPGLALGASTGTITGTPTASGQYSFTLQVRDSAASPQTASKQLGISVGTAAPQITTTTLPNGTVQVAYSATLAATGGTPPYNWSAVSGSLPPGLALGASTGTITGTPTTSGQYSFTLQVRDSAATPQTASKQFGISVGTATPQITTSTLPNGILQAAYSATLAATGGTPPYNWSVVSGSLPPGLALGTSTGAVIGTPTGSGQYSFSVQVKDSAASPQTATNTFTLSIAAAALQITTSALADGTVQVPYSVTLAATGGTPPYNWGISSGSLPPGLSFSAVGSISGIPTTAGSYGFGITAYDSGRQTATRNFTVSVTDKTSVQCNVTFNPGDNLPAIVSNNPSGTTFCFSSGVYRMTTYITPKNNDIFSGSPGVVLNGSQLVTSFTQSGSYWIANGQTQRIPQTSEVCLPSVGTACEYSEGVFLDDKPLNRVLSLSQMASGNFYFDYNSSSIYLADNPAGHKVEAVVADHPILAVQTGVDGVTIQGLTIEKFGGSVGGAVQGRTTWIIQNNEVRLNHGTGIGADGKILGNFSHDNGDFGLEGGYATTAMDVENNEFSLNNWANFSNGGGAKFDYATNLVVRNNYSHDNNGSGFHSDGDNNNVLYEYNHTKNNTNAGIEYEISWNAIIRYNLLENETSVFPQNSSGSLWDNDAILIENSSGVQVYGNTISNCVNGIGAVLSDRGTSPYGAYAGQQYLVKNLDVYENTITQNVGAAVGIVKASTFDNSVYTSWNNHFASDAYKLADLNGLYFTWMDSSGKNAYSSYTKDQWQSFGNDVQGTFVLIP